MNFDKFQGGNLLNFIDLSNNRELPISHKSHFDLSSFVIFLFCTILVMNKNLNKKKLKNYKKELFDKIVDTIEN